MPAKRTPIDKESMFRKIMPPSDAAPGEAGEGTAVSSTAPEAVEKGNGDVPVNASSDMSQNPEILQGTEKEDTFNQTEETKSENIVNEADSDIMNGTFVPNPAETSLSAPQTEEMGDMTPVIEQTDANYEDTTDTRPLTSPAQSAAAPSTAEQESPPPDMEPALSQPQPQTQPPQPSMEAAPMPEPEPAAPPSQDETPQQAPAAPAQLASSNVQTLPPQPDGPVPQPINLAERMAENLYERYRQRLDGCPCDRCRDDSLGLALNKIRPRYVTSDTFQESDLQDRALATETVTALMKAIMRVKARPNHDNTNRRI